jgi:deazaflavin-dependent oxidoreductase (nitroreductase family)
MNRLSDALVRALGRVNVALYRRSGGRVFGRVGRARILLLTTTGRRSGEARTAPLLYLRDESRFVVVASFGGHASHPAWYLNLAANPEVEVEVDRERFQARARTATPEEHARLWPTLVEMYGPYASYQRRTSRVIPIVLLEPAEEPGS